LTYGDTHHITKIHAIFPYGNVNHITKIHVMFPYGNLHRITKTHELFPMETYIILLKFIRFDLWRHTSYY